MASDIGVRSLIMNDIMPSLVCRYLKVSVMWGDPGGGGGRTEVRRGVRSLIMNDIMPSLVCRYLKVSVMVGGGEDPGGGDRWAEVRGGVRYRRPVAHHE